MNREVCFRCTCILIGKEIIYGECFPCILEQKKEDKRYKNIKYQTHLFTRRVEKCM